LTGAVFLAAFAGRVFAAALLTGDFFCVAFFVVAVFAFAASALFRAERRFVAATIAALPLAESFRFGFAGSGAAAGSDSRFVAAHRLL
jgi:hypothetical protein